METSIRDKISTDILTLSDFIAFIHEFEMKDGCKQIANANTGGGGTLPAINGV